MRKAPEGLYGLDKFEENSKFKGYKSLFKSDGLENEGIGAFVRDLKEEFRTVEYVFVWHAFCGYWGGVTPKAPGMPESKVVRVKMSKSVEKMMEDQAMGKMVKDGFGFVGPKRAAEFYEGMHSSLESAGIVGVKIDAIHVRKSFYSDFFFFSGSLLK